MEWASKVRPEEADRGRRQRADIQARIDGILGEGDVPCLLCVSGRGGLPRISLPLAGRSMAAGA